MLKTIYDEFGNSHQIDDENKLGEGAQGAVYKVKDTEKLVVKIVSQATTADDMTPEQGEALYQRYKTKIQHVMALVALSPVEHLAVPIALLKAPNKGYIMQFMSDMESIKQQMPRTKEAMELQSYKNTCLKKKYKVLKGLAKILMDLHTQGLVYCDISPNNVFISKKPDSFETWLIDVDNLSYAGRPKKMCGTPKYRAPELIGATRAIHTAQSDIYAFALLAYEYLVVASPFHGSLANDGIVVEEDDWDADNDDRGMDNDDRGMDNDDRGMDNDDAYDKKIELGHIPYVHEGAGNRPIDESGFPPEVVFTEELKALFLQTFGESGRNHPQNRPAASRWYEAFDHAVNMVFVCSGGHTILKKDCPFCESKHKSEKNPNYFFSLTIESCVPQEETDNWDTSDTPSPQFYRNRTFHFWHKRGGRTTTLRTFSVPNTLEIAAEVTCKKFKREVALEMEIRENKRVKKIWDMDRDLNGCAFLVCGKDGMMQNINLKWLNPAIRDERGGRV